VSSVEPSRRSAKNSPQSMNNAPLAKMYPEAAKKMAAAKKRAEKKALDKKVATNFMKKMTTRIPSPTAVQRARRNAKAAIQNRVSYEQNKALAAVNQASPRAVMRVARELRRLR
jgi:hypothetical protein